MSDGVRVYSGALPVLAIILLIALVVLIIPLIIWGLVGAAFSRLGIPWIAALAIVLLMLIGSFVNIPLYRIKRDMVRVDTMEMSLGAQPVWETEISLNLGGAVIPLAVSAYLLYQANAIVGSGLFMLVIAGVVLVALIAWVSTRSIPGYGLRAPLFLPGLAAILCGILLAGETGLEAGVIAFVAGTVGILLGSGIAQIPRIRDMEIPNVSIGGAGMFGAIFLACLLSALIA